MYIIVINFLQSYSHNYENVGAVGAAAQRCSFDSIDYAKLVVIDALSCIRTSYAHTATLYEWVLRFQNSILSMYACETVCIIKAIYRPGEWLRRKTSERVRQEERERARARAIATATASSTGYGGTCKVCALYTYRTGCAYSPACLWSYAAYSVLRAENTHFSIWFSPLP